MIVMDKKDKNLTIPSALGNFGNGGGTGGITPEEAAEIASAITEEAIDEYDTELQVELEEIREAISGNTGTLLDLEVELSAVTSSVEALSGATENVLSDIETLSGVTEDTYGAIFYENEGQTYSQIDDLWSALDDKQDTLGAGNAGNGIAINDSQISVDTGDSLGFDPDGHLQVEIGAGMDRDEDDALTLKVGEGLGFSGDTLVVSGISAGGGYVIADTFDDIDNPEEGTMAYVKGYNVSGWTIDATPFGSSEGFCAYVHYDGTSSNTRIYYAGGSFHWGWDNNQTTWGPGQNVNYKIDKNNKLFYVYCDNADAYIEPADPAVATITPTVFNIPVKELYLNNGTDWEQKDFVKLYFLDNMSNDERVALYDEITSYTDHTFPAWKYRFFVGSYDNDEFLGNFEVFVARFEGYSIQFSGLMSSRYDPTLLMRGYRLEDNGDFSKSFEANKTLPNAPYDPFLIASYDNNNMCLTGITHETKANMWEGYKQEGSEYVRKTVVAYVHTGDNLPARFHLIHAEGDFNQDEDNAELHFGSVSNSVGDAALHSVRFRLTKDTANDVYTIDNIVEYTYNSQ